MRRLVVLAAVATVTIAPLTYAQTIPSDSTTARGDSASKRSATKLGAVQVVEKASRKKGYAARLTTSATKTPTALQDLPQSVSVVTHDLIADQSMQSLADVVRYVPGITLHQGEGNRDQMIIRGNNTSSDLFVDGVRDDIQYYRDLYNVDRVEALTGASAMMFGRGSGGGVINRVMKQPTWSPVREFTLQGGSYDNRRAMLDMGQGLTDALAARINGMYENSGSFRDAFKLKRWGVNPLLRFSPGDHTSAVTLSYEHFNDHRTADRGVPSFNGRPFDSDISTFFGNPDVSYANARVDVGEATLSHTTGGGLHIQNHTRWAAYDKIYQNVFPGAVNSQGTQVTITAYNNAARRHNIFNQTDLTYGTTTGSVTHMFLVGAELGRQVTNNFRNTGYFNNLTTSTTTSVDTTQISTPVTFRQSATDANNHVVTTANSVYAEDQIALTSWLQVVAGLREQLFNINYHNNRGDTTRTRSDHLLSPKAGIVLKPVEQLSVYTSYSISYLPSSGDQFSSLTNITQALQPEKFTNAEVGAKWQPLDRLGFTGAVYRLDRTNTRAPDPVDPTLSVQTGKARSSGTEVSATGAVTSFWQVVGTYTNQNARIVSRTSAATPGTSVALVPHTIASLWNKVQVAPRVSLGLGASRRSDMYAAVDNSVTLPGYTRVDGAAFFSLNEKMRAQVNVDNLFDKKYYLTADSNNNITPGAPRAVRVTLSTDF